MPRPGAKFPPSLTGYDDREDTLALVLFWCIVAASASFQELVFHLLAIPQKLSASS
jgi:hypothetical protein